MQPACVRRDHESDSRFRRRDPPGCRQLSPAGAFLFRRSSALSRVCMRIATALRFSRTSTTSSCTPSMLVYRAARFDLHLGDRRTRHRGQQHATQRVASVWPKPRSKGSITTRAGAARSAAPSRHGASKIHLPRMSSDLQHYFEYSSTTSFVDIRQDVAAARGRLERARNSFSLTSSQSGKPTWAATVSALATRNCLRDFSRSCTTSPAFTW